MDNTIYKFKDPENITFAEWEDMPFPEPDDLAEECFKDYATFAEFKLRDDIFGMPQDSRFPSYPRKFLQAFAYEWQMCVKHNFTHYMFYYWIHARRNDGKRTPCFSFLQSWKQENPNGDGTLEGHERAYYLTNAEIDELFRSGAFEEELEGFPEDDGWHRLYSLYLQGCPAWVFKPAGMKPGEARLGKKNVDRICLDIMNKRCSIEDAIDRCHSRKQVDEVMSILHSFGTLSREELERVMNASVKKLFSLKR